MLPATDNPKANIQRATTLVREAALSHGAEVVVLPECTLTGYSQPTDEGSSVDETRAITETIPGPSTEHFAKLANELNIYIIWGLHEKRGDKYYNSATLLSPDGKLLGTYRKVHINKYEAIMGWSNGDQFHVWSCKIHGIDFNLGIMICFDREVPEAARCLTALGADLIVVPQATGCTCQLPIHRDQLRVRAYENEVYLAMANWAGPIFQGHSMIIRYDGETINLGDENEKILFAELDMNALRKYRESGIYGRHHRQPSAYGPLLDT